MPANKSAEDCVIGCALLSPSSIDEVSFLRPEHFYQTDAGLTWACVSEMRRQGKAIDTELVAAELVASGKLNEAGGPQRLLYWLETVPHTAHAKHYASIVMECWRRRETIRSCESAINAVHDASVPLDETVLSTEAKLHGVLDAKAQHSAVSIGDVLLDAIAQIDAKQARGAMVGFNQLDQVLGGLKPKQLLILAARPSMGKTAIACQMAVQIGELGCGVLFISIEMGRLEISQRFLSGWSSVPLHRLDRNELQAGDRERIVEAASMLSHLPLALDEESDTLTAIAAATRITKRRQPLSVVIVDYLQLIRPEHRAANREQEVSTISRGLKRIAKQNDVAVLALAQMNRASATRENKEPQLPDLRESGAIEQDADVVMFLHRPGYYDPKLDESLTNIFVRKQRNGPLGKSCLEWHKETVRFSETSDWSR